MSSNILHKRDNILHKRNIDYGKRFVVDNRRAQEKLSDFIKRIRSEKNLSLEQVKANSNGAIAGSYINRIENGQVANPSGAKIKALAKGLKITEEEIFAVVRGKPLDEASVLKAHFSSLIEDIENLNPSDKDFVIKGLESLRVQVRERIESYKKSPDLYLIKGEEGIDLLVFLPAIKKVYPQYATDMILDILGNRNLDAYTSEQITDVQEFKDGFTKKNYSALVTTG